MVRENHLVYQAKSFYNAYIALEQIGRQAEDDLLLYIPTIVNGAFSCELTLKAILAKNKIKYDNEHNLLSLFELLPDSFQNELLGHLIQKAPEYKEAKKFVEELILISNAFVDWRYAFEDKPVPAFDTRFLSAFANAAIWTMFSHYNVSLERCDDTEKTDDEIEEMFRENRERCKRINIEKFRKKKK